MCECVCVIVCVRVCECLRGVNASVCVGTCVFLVTYSRLVCLTLLLSFLTSSVCLPLIVFPSLSFFPVISLWSILWQAYRNDKRKHESPQRVFCSGAAELEEVEEPSVLIGLIRFSR